MPGIPLWISVVSNFIHNARTKMISGSKIVLSSTVGSLFEYSRPVSIICTDASAFACGVHALSIDKEEFDLFYKAFSSFESALDSNGRELLTILYSLKSFKSLIQGKVVKLYTDS